MKGLRWIIAMVFVSLVIHPAAQGQSPGELLEKGIYTEETVGDIDSAISIYRRIVRDAKAARPHVALAHYRLGMCYLKKGHTKEALAVFEQLAGGYRDQEKVVARAQRRIAEVRGDLDRDDIRELVKSAVMTISTCTETDPRVPEALSSLQGLDATATTGELVAFLESDKNTVRRAAIYILWKAEMDDITPAVTKLKKLCGHEEDLTRGMVALTLGARKIESSYETLREMAMEDSSGYARRCAAYALGLAEDTGARPVLEKALKDPDSMVRNNAEAALTMLSKVESLKTGSKTRKPSYSQTHHFTLHADGSGSHTSESSSVNRSTSPMKTYSFINSTDDIEKVLDEEGNELPFKVTRQGGHYAFSVKLHKPVPPGKKYTHQIVTRRKNLATRRGDRWVYKRHHTPIPETDYTETVTLPYSARVASVTPTPTSTTNHDGHMRLRFEQHLRRNQAFVCTIYYKLEASEGVEKASALPTDAVEVGYGGDHSDGKRSLGGSGHAVTFERPATARYLEAVRIFAGRYGHPQAPEEDFHLYVLDHERKVLATLPFPYSMVERGDLAWYSLRTPSIEVPVRFMLALSFNPHRTKGIYLGFDQAAGTSHSFTGLPAAGFSPVQGGQNWMVKAMLSEKPSGAKGVQRLAKAEAPVQGSSGGSEGLQVLIDAARPGSVVNVPRGTYREPLRIDKALTLRGQDPDACILDLTADKPALLITSKKRVTIESMTIKWQRATSSRTPEPACAVVLKDAQATLKDCRLIAPGGNTRCPCAVLAFGFSDLHLDGCRFEGYEFTVQIGSGANGKVENCLFLKPGHCGITVSSDGKGEIVNNVVTGSSYHGVRCTGGTLDVRNNLIIRNKNRGIYLGNKSAGGSVRNNVILGNGTGISAFANTEVDIAHNLLLDSAYAGLDFRDSCRLRVESNILAGNERGIVQFKESGRGGTSVGVNTFWNNKTDTENLEKSKKALTQDPRFKDPGRGNFTVGQPAIIKSKQGLEDTTPFPPLWEKWDTVSSMFR